MDDPAIPPVAADQPPLARLLGLRLVSATPDRVVAELTARPDLLNRNGMLHGGAIMALADNLGGTATFLNLAPGEGTTTIESKTNFFRAVPAGVTLTAVTTPLHRGRTTQVWQTALTLPDGRLAAQVTQTQMVLQPR
ncbi:MAG: PaaI family thioesterase [Rhodobacterales bacterium]|nr:PaaI family thioesterase [Rhodobacterales bacterium]